MIRVLASLVDIVLVKRWNLLLGIPDKAFYLLGDAIIYQLCCASTAFSLPLRSRSEPDDKRAAALSADTLDFMPGVVLTSKLCPKHVEATTYALLAGVPRTLDGITIAADSLFCSIFFLLSFARARAHLHDLL